MAAASPPHGFAGPPNPPDSATVTSLVVGPLPLPSRYISAAAVTYSQRWMGERSGGDGSGGGGGGGEGDVAPPPTHKVWEVLRGVDAVSVLLHHTRRRTFLLARQFRPAVWYAARRRAGGEDGAATDGGGAAGLAATAGSGFVLELCGGLCDKPGLSPEGAAVEEVEEEMGYAVAESALRQVCEFPEALGLLGTRLCTYYVAVTDGDRVPGGGEWGGGSEGVGEGGRG